MAKVDNFDLIRKILKFENPGDCYYLQLLRRQSDDPMIDGNPDPNYHGNMHSRSLKDYLIPSIEYLDRKEEEIKQLEGMKLVLVLSDGTQIEIPYEIVDGKLVFTTELFGVFAFIPVEAE